MRGVVAGVVAVSLAGGVALAISRAGATGVAAPHDRARAGDGPRRRRDGDGAGSARHVRRWRRDRIARGGGSAAAWRDERGVVAPRFDQRFCCSDRGGCHALVAAAGRVRRNLLGTSVKEGMI